MSFRNQTSQVLCSKIVIELVTSFSECFTITRAKQHTSVCLESTVMEAEGLDKLRISYACMYVCMQDVQSTLSMTQDPSWVKYLSMGKDKNAKTGGF